MTIKNVFIDSNGTYIGYSTINETYGGQEIRIGFTQELGELVNWWKEWKPVFESKDPTVVDLLNQAKVLSKVV